MGRPKGYSPGWGRTHTHHQAEWSWNSPRLHSKIEETPGCWIWHGAKGPNGNLFGAYKNNRPQMTQTNRILYMEETGQDISEYAIYTVCLNKYCCNPDHFELQPNRARGIKNDRS